MLYARINQKGQLEYENEIIRRNVIEPLVGVRVKVEITESKKARSLGWNAYYWKIVIPNGSKAAKEKGWEFSSEEIHEQFKKAFLKDRIKRNTKTGESKKLPPSTTSLTSEQFQEYCIKCNQFTYEQSGVYIPLPEELKKGEVFRK